MWAQEEDMYCLTTTTRRIPCVGKSGIILFADWEEIADSDVPALTHWYRMVWLTLNGSEPPKPSEAALEAEAGLSPDCQIACRDWMGRRTTKRLSDVRIGDYVCDGPRSTTRVVGKVVIAGDQATDAVEVGGQFMSCATWVQVQRPAGWRQAAELGTVHEIHPIRWEHLYTESGQFVVADILVRDASDVGLSNLRPLVDSVVLNRF